MDGLVPNIFHGERSELREKYGLGAFGGGAVRSVEISGQGKVLGASPP
jgi:hypothetical protein